MKVAVVGMGLFGRAIAANLARAGVEVIAIDIDASKIDRVRDEVTLAVAMDATDPRELEEQGVHKVDLLIASIGNNFEANQLLVMEAKKLGIPRVLARAPSQGHARILEMLGADQVVLPEIEAAERTALRLLEEGLAGQRAPPARAAPPNRSGSKGG